MLDHASQSYGRLVDLTTDGVSARERIDYWRDVVLRRTRPELPERGQSFQAHLRRIVLNEVELIEHAASAVVSGRSPGRTRFDGGDDIALELIRYGTSNLTHNGEHRLGSGDLCLVDYARPFKTVRTHHRASGVVLSRRRVREVLGDDLSGLAGRRVPARGLAAVLRAHMTTTLDESPRMTPEDRVIATNAAAEMALAILQAGRFGAADPEQFGEGLYRAARALIDRACPDPDLSPDRIALAVGCSRAALYRLFARRDQSVAAVVRQARLERARRMLCSAESTAVPISDVAMQSGFTDMPTFTRMFKRRYGKTPREARVAWAEGDDERLG
ncbi:MAG: AraC family transcriptional regulator [Reyranella sp.]|uniref:AraC family transcriptional regulator n=1 Tax=Reyranella sp. TaxID=1929291 RepID=UPI0011F5DDF2|nr:AraC family transcriptional regulator [Reyranella sp.]TAJ38634.1 MAG: AraC family transcriptional regulator [Reyranella sp.]